MLRMVAYEYNLRASNFVLISWGIADFTNTPIVTIWRSLWQCQTFFQGSG